MIHMQGCRSYSNFQRALIYIYNHRRPRCLTYRNAGCTSLPFKFSLVFQLCLIEFVMLLLFTMSPNRKKCWSWSKFGSMLMRSTHCREFFLKLCRLIYFFGIALLCREMWFLETVSVPQLCLLQAHSCQRILEQEQRQICGGENCCIAKKKQSSLFYWLEVFEAKIFTAVKYLIFLVRVD